jgi:hypothetical protein
VAHLRPRPRLLAAVDAQHIGGPRSTAGIFLRVDTRGNPQISGMSIFP